MPGNPGVMGGMLWIAMAQVVLHGAQIGAGQEVLRSLVGIRSVSEPLFTFRLLVAISASLRSAICKECYNLKCDDTGVLCKKLWRAVSDAIDVITRARLAAAALAPP